MPKLRDVEAVLAQNAQKWLEQKELNGYESHEVTLHRVVKNVQTSVYGRESGESGTDVIANDVKCILVDDDFFPSDSYSSGSFQEGWMYTTDLRVQVGDLVDVPRAGGSGTRRYEINALQALGTTIKVFRKFRLSAKGD